MGAVVAGCAAALVLCDSPSTGPALVAGRAIQGTVVSADNGQGIAGVEVRTSGGAGALSAADGSFSIAVAEGWTGMLGASGNGFIISPDSTPVLADGSLDKSIKLTAVPLSAHTTNNTGDRFHFQFAYPNGGEVFYVGQKIALRIWNDDQGYCSFESSEAGISLDGSLFYKLNVVSVPGDEDGWATYVWTVPAAMPDGVSAISETCTMRMVCYEENENFDKTDGSFSIRAMPR